MWLRTESYWGKFVQTFQLLQTDIARSLLVEQSSWQFWHISNAPWLFTIFRVNHLFWLIKTSLSAGYFFKTTYTIIYDSILDSATMYYLEWVSVFPKINMYTMNKELQKKNLFRKAIDAYRDCFWCFFPICPSSDTCNSPERWIVFSQDCCNWD